MLLEIFISCFSVEKVSRQSVARHLKILMVLIKVKRTGERKTPFIVYKNYCTQATEILNLSKGYQIPYLSHPDFTSRLSEFKDHQLLRYISSSMADLQIHSSIGKSHRVQYLPIINYTLPATLAEKSTKLFGF